MSAAIRSLLRGAGFALLGLLAVAPASASTVTVMMTGTWSSVADTAQVLDGSIVAGGGFTATFTYDDQVPDTEPTAGIGSYLMNGSVGSLAFSTGNYSFIDQGISGNGVGTEDSVQGVDLVGLFFDRYAISGPLPSGVQLAPLAYANPTFTDYTQTALSSDRLTGIPWNASLWTTDFYFFGPVTNRGAKDYIELDGVITGMTVSAPEPGVAWMLAASVAALALRRRRASL